MQQMECDLFSRWLAGLGIDDAPLDKRINENVLFLRGDETFRIRRIERQDAFVEIAHILNHRPLEIEPGFADNFAHLTQLEDDCILALVDREDRGRKHRDERSNHSCSKIEPRPHHRTSRSRVRNASRSRVEL